MKKKVEKNHYHFNLHQQFNLAHIKDQLITRGGVIGQLYD